MGCVIKNVWVYRGLRCLVSAIFLGSGIVKLMDPAAFAVVIDAFGILPEGFSAVVALILPSLEIAAAVALIFNGRGSLESLSVLMLLFMGILAYGIFLGLDIDCGCFGPEDPESRAFGGLRTALYRDMGICGLMALAYGARYFRHDSGDETGLESLDPQEG